MGHILIVDDEPQVCALVRRILEGGGFPVVAAQSGGAMRAALRSGETDLVILDLMLGAEDGLDLLRDLRDKSQVPVIILTAMGDPGDRVTGLEMGADDYLPKPFEPRELLARVRSVLRRAAPSAEPGANGVVLRFRDWRLDTRNRRLTDPQGAAVSLTTAQFDLLAVLATHPNRVLSRDKLLDLARDRVAMAGDRSIDVHIGHLRRKIEPDPRRPTLIKTVHGAGYIFTPSVERD